MHRLGSHIHLLIGLWIMAGLMIVGINGYMLLFLLDEPLAGHSDAVRSADKGFRQYRLLLTAETEKINSGMDMLTRRFKSVAVEEEKPKTPKPVVPPQASPKTTHDQVELPTLTGILTSQSANGTISRLALLDGRICIEGEQFRDLKVEGITPKGVSLARGKQSWFIKAPEIAYSLTTQ